MALKSVLGGPALSTPDGRLALLNAILTASIALKVCSVARSKPIDKLLLMALAGGVARVFSKCIANSTNFDESNRELFDFVLAHYLCMTAGILISK